MTITSADPTSPLVIDDAQLIGGRWIGACGGQTIDVINPATGQVLGRVPRGDSADVDLAVAAAQQAFPAWRDTGEDEAVAVANGTEYGLVASVWTGDVGRAVRMSRKLAAGQVVVNAALGAGVIGGPFGGYKHSGFGRTMGADAVLDYTQVKTVSMRGTQSAAARG
jgi:acyl-CoA reductase-like NAD-dependent aldehyde dehydrogenase